MTFNLKNRLLDLDDKIITDVYLAPIAADVDLYVTAVALQTGASWADKSLTVAAQPAYARNITLTFVDGDTSISAGTVTIVGTDIRGDAVTEVITGIVTATTLSYAGDVAFRTITSITVSGFTGATQTNDTIKVGCGDIYGLTCELYATADVLQVIETGVDSTAYTVDTTYNTVDFDDVADASSHYSIMYESKTLW